MAAVVKIFCLLSVIVVLVQLTNQQQDKQLEWQRFIPKICSVVLHRYCDIIEVLSEALACMKTAQYKVVICDKNSSNNLWLTETNLTVVGMCGLIRPPIHAWNITKLVSTITIVPRRKFGLNVSFEGFHLPSVNGRCKLDTVTTSKGTQKETHCGHKLPWYMISQNDNITITYRMIRSGLLAGEIHWGFNARYQIINREESRGIHEEWLTFRIAYIPDAYQFGYRIKHTPALIPFVTLHNTNVPSLLAEKAGVTYLATNFGWMYYKKNFIRTKLLIMTEPSLVINTQVCLGPCMEASIFDGPHHQSPILLTIAKQTCRKVASTGFVEIVEMLLLMRCPHQVSGHIRLNYFRSAYQLIYTNTEHYNRNLPSHEYCMYVGLGVICHLMFNSGNRFYTSGFVNISATVTESTGPNPPWCLYRGVHISTLDDDPSYPWIEQQLSSTFDYHYLRTLISPNIAQCETNKRTPLRFNSYSSKLVVVVYHYATERSKFNVRLSVSQTQCPGYTVHCGMTRDFTSLEQFKPLNFINFKEHDMFIERHQNPSFYCQRKRIIKDRLKYVCLGGHKDNSLTVLNHPKIHCFSIQYISNNDETNFNHKCSFGVHTWPWQSMISYVTYDNMDFCQVVSISKVDESKGFKKVVFNPTCGNLYADMTLQNTSMRLYSHNLHPDFHFMELPEPDRKILRQRSLSEKQNDAELSIVDNPFDVWVICSSDELFQRSISLGMEVGEREEIYMGSYRYTDQYKWSVLDHSTYTNMTVQLGQDETVCSELDVKYNLLHVVFTNEAPTLDSFMERQEYTLGHYVSSNYYGMAKLTHHQSLVLFTTEAYHMRILLIQPHKKEQLPCLLNISLEKISVEKSTFHMLPLQWQNVLYDPTYKSQKPDVEVGRVLSNFTHFYQVTWSEMKLSWKEAEENCQSIGGHLPTVSTDVDNSIVKRIILGNRFTTDENFLSPSRLQKMTLVFIGKNTSKVNQNSHKSCRMLNYFSLLDISDQININSYIYIYI